VVLLLGDLVVLLLLGQLVLLLGEMLVLLLGDLVVVVLLLGDHCLIIHQYNCLYLLLFGLQ